MTVVAELDHLVAEEARVSVGDHEMTSAWRDGQGRHQLRGGGSRRDDDEVGFAPAAVGADAPRGDVFDGGSFAHGGAEGAGPLQEVLVAAGG